MRADLSEKGSCLLRVTHKAIEPRAALLGGIGLLVLLRHRRQA
jgi:hypothetical protein